jgi:hypothetical protein
MSVINPTMMRHACACTHMDRQKSIGNVKGGTASPRYKENIKLNPIITKYEDFDWIHVAQDILQWGIYVNMTFFIKVR